MNKKDLLNLFQNKITRESYRTFIKEIFKPDHLFLPDEFDPVETISEDVKGFYIGNKNTSDRYKIGFFYYEIGRSNVARKKVGLRKLVDSYTKGNYAQFEAAIVAFTDEKNWRLSFICNLNGETTAAKRFTFVFGESENLYKTPIERFGELQQKGLNKKNIQDAFSVEALNDQFFADYKAHYEKFCNFLYEHADDPNYFGEEFAHWNSDEKTQKYLRDYVKNLLGRIVFLHFLQKKGWMGVPVDSTEWKGGSQNFMYELFKNSTQSQKENFLDDVLESLFFNCLNTDRSADNDVYDTKVISIGKVRIPYLNGELFEKGFLDTPKSKFSVELFENLFNLFNSYNFTIDENDPSDAEIGVDPEMLGKIFENLLEDNKDKGAFYTPKEIVNYMCKESLIAYLQSKFGKAHHDSIRTLVNTHLKDQHLEEDQNVCGRLNKALRDVKVCDPAIGSGAFPMGLLNEIFACRCQLETTDKPKSELKGEIIQNNIYGVDIERGAVDIARLRFWLALIVDAEKPVPLPNLDYKIMQGNSLLESYKGLDLSNLMQSDDMFVQMKAEEVEKDIKAYYKAKSNTDKKNLREQINFDIVQCLRFAGFQDDIEIPNTDFFLWHTYFKDVFDEGGFDIVIGNPPYVESRNSSIDESQKNAIQQQLRLRHTKDEVDCFPRGADLLIFFFELSFTLANKSGINTFITENSWLSTDYGSKFQSYLLNNVNTLGIIDSDYKYFDNADVNTIITFFENRGLRNVDSVPFVHCHGDLSIHPYALQESNKDNTITVNIFERSNEILRRHKWGFLFSINDRLLQLLDTLSKKENKAFREKIEIGQGLNLTKDCILTQPSSNSSPYFNSANGPQYRWSNTLYYVDNLNVKSKRRKPLLILPRGLGTHFCCMNEIGGYSASYVEIYQKSQLSHAEKLKLWLFCNSSLCWVLREYTGRCNLGGGMLKAEATDLKRLPLCFEFEDIEEINEIYNMCFDEKVPTNIDEAVSSKIHSRIDEIVYAYFGIEDYLFVNQMLLERFHWRNRKSKKK